MGEAKRRRAMGDVPTRQTPPIPQTPQTLSGEWLSEPTSEEIKRSFLDSYSFGEDRDRALGSRQRMVADIIGEMFAELQHGCAWDFDSERGGLRWAPTRDTPDAEPWFHSNLPVLIRLGPATFERAVLRYVEVMQQDVEEGWTAHEQMTVISCLCEWQATIMRLQNSVGDAEVDDPEEDDDFADEPQHNHQEGHTVTASTTTPESVLAVISESTARLERLLADLNAKAPIKNDEPLDWDPVTIWHSPLEAALVCIEDEDAKLDAAIKAEVERLYPNPGGFTWTSDYYSRRVTDPGFVDPPTIAAYYSLLRRWRELKHLIEAKRLLSGSDEWAAWDPWEPASVSPDDLPEPDAGCV